MPEKNGRGAPFPGDFGKEIEPRQPAGLLDGAALPAGAASDVVPAGDAFDPERRRHGPREPGLLPGIGTEPVVEVRRQQRRAAGPLAHPTGGAEQVKKGRRVHATGKPDQDGPVPGIVRKPGEGGGEGFPHRREHGAPRRSPPRRRLSGDPGIRRRPVHPLSLPGRLVPGGPARCAAW